MIKRTFRFLSQRNQRRMAAALRRAGYVVVSQAQWLTVSCKSLDMNVRIIARRYEAIEYD